MTIKMLPPAPKDVGRLSDVFISALGAITGGADNRLKLRRVSSALVVVIDGLGFENLREYSGHARNLSAALTKSGDKSIRCAFPSTTAVSLASFATGLFPGTHGLFGYQVRDADGSPKNMLTGWTRPSEADQWRTGQTVSRRALAAGIEVNMIADPAYEGSAFTELIMAETSFVGVLALGERVRKAVALANQAKTLNYLYFAELDQAAHRFGVGSSQWLGVLEEIDGAVAAISGNFGFVITADHGVMNVSASQHVFLDEIPGWTTAVEMAVGDPRALLCYGDKEQASELIAAEAWSAHVVGWNELQRLGWVGEQSTNSGQPDFYLIASDGIAFYDRRTAKPQSLKMIGQHGGLSDVEQRIPLILGGLFL